MTKSRKRVVVYGFFWCPDTHRSARLLRKLGVPYVARATENPRVARALERLVRGKDWATPTIFFPDGTRLVEPDNPTLRRKIKNLREQGLLK